MGENEMPEDEVPDSDPEIHIEVLEQENAITASPRTPRMPHRRNHNTAAENERRNVPNINLAEQRRDLVITLFRQEGIFPSTQASSDFQTMHNDIFPSKSVLLFQMREVRQMIMQTPALML